MASNGRSMVSINKAVNAALIDTYSDIGKNKELYLHWAGRAVKKLHRETLRLQKRKVLLEVNTNTKTAVLPPDFDFETFVGIINENGKKQPLNESPDMIGGDIKVVYEENRCEKCNQERDICNDLTVTISEETVVINGTTATKTTTKKLYPDGRYYLEVIHPYWNEDTKAIEYVPTKELITEIDLLDCGCVKPTKENINKIKKCCHGVYDCYFAGEEKSCGVSVGGYKIFNENLGVIAFDWCFPYNFVYLEYQAFLPKVGSNYLIPEECFETVVEYIKYKAIRNKRSTTVTLTEKEYQRLDYERARKNMLKIMTRVSINDILISAKSLPRFNIKEFDICPTKYVSRGTSGAQRITQSSNGCVYGGEATEGNNAQCKQKKTISQPFQIALIVGAGGYAPVTGSLSFTHPELVGANNIQYIIIDNNNESQLMGDFTFDALTGNITRAAGKAFIEGSVVIIPFTKIVEVCG